VADEAGREGSHNGRREDKKLATCSFFESTCITHLFFSTVYYFPTDFPTAAKCLNPTLFTSTPHLKLMNYARC
jgi:hypothetical protein